jgi:hypothetical protein
MKALSAMRANCDPNSKAIILRRLQRSGSHNCLKALVLLMELTPKQFSPITVTADGMQIDV